MPVSKAGFAAEQVASSLVDKFGWRWKHMHLRTGSYEQAPFFQAGKTQISVITYGILWKWLQTSLLVSNRCRASEGFVFFVFFAMGRFWLRVIEVQVGTWNGL